MEAADGKKYTTYVLSTRDILRLVQSIPSPKAEPLKMWLAQVGSDRLDEIADPEKAIMRAADYYHAKGYSDQWINQRLQAIEMRKELTDEWKARGIEQELEYAILTNDMTKPMGVATYHSSSELPEAYKNILPSAEELRKLL